MIFLNSGKEIVNEFPVEPQKSDED